MGTMDGFLKMGLDPGAILIPEIKGGCPFTLKSICAEIFRPYTGEDQPGIPKGFWHKCEGWRKISTKPATWGIPTHGCEAERL